jgi:predicted DsbA family dithiol-disulfide isomerase
MTLVRATTIEVYADISCPFTHLGLRRFVQRRAQAGRPNVSLRVRAWPLEIVNGAPLDPAFIAEEVVTLRGILDPDAFAKFDEATFPASTLPALALAEAAYRESLEVGEAVSLHLRALLFDEGLDVSDDAVLSAVASDFDLEVSDADRAAVLADRAEGARRGVIGSPHFFTPAGDYFCPALDISRGADGHLEAELNSERFEQFVGECLDPR